MNLEKTVRFHFPKSTLLSDEVHSTSTDQLKTADIMAALGFAQQESGFGMSAFFGKMGVSQNDKNQAVTNLMKITRRRVMKCKVFEKLSGRQRGRVIYLIALFAFEDYCRSAASPEIRCPSCKGRGEVRDIEQIALTHQRVMKTCSRCKGKGFKALKASKLFDAVRAIAPEMSKSVFYRDIKPVFDDLIQVCFKEESRADNALKKVTALKSY